MAKRKNGKKQHEKYQTNEYQLKIKRPYKDTIFRMLYHDKENLLSLYNAMNGKKYTNPDGKTLKEYAQYVARVRRYTTEKDISLKAAVERAVDECIAEGILTEFLMKNKAEVIKVSIYEYDKEFEEKKLRKAEYEAGRLEGIEFGKRQGIEAGERKHLESQIEKKLQKGKMVEQIADELEEEVSAIQEIIDKKKEK